MENSLQKIIDDNPKTIWYSTLTPWWTHKSEHIQKLAPPLPSVKIKRSDGSIYEIKSESYKMPTDLFGCPLMQTENVFGWLDKKRILENEQYGKKRMNNFLMMHHENLIKLIKEFKIWIGKEIMYKDIFDKYVEFLDQRSE